MSGTIFAALGGQEEWVSKQGMERCLLLSIAQDIDLQHSGAGLGKGPFVPVDVQLATQEDKKQCCHSTGFALKRLALDLPASTMQLTSGSRLKGVNAFCMVRF